MSKQNALKATIDRMVEDSIRRILPEVMNEVLLRTLSKNVVQEQARPAPQQRRQAPQQRQPQQRVNVQRQRQLAGIDRSMSLREALSADDVGADYYEQAERMIEGRQQQQRAQQRQVQRPAPQPVYEEYDQPADEMYEEDEVFDYNSPPPTQQQRVQEQVAQRIQQMPPALQGLAEETFRLVDDSEFEDDGGGEWGANEWAPVGNAGQQARAPNINIDRAAGALGLDFNRFAQTIAVTEGVNKPKITQQDVQNEAQWKMQQLERKRALLDSKKVGG